MPAGLFGAIFEYALVDGTQRYLVDTVMTIVVKPTVNAETRLNDFDSSDDAVGVGVSATVVRAVELTERQPGTFTLWSILCARDEIAAYANCERMNQSIVLLGDRVHTTIFGLIPSHLCLSKSLCLLF
jgi:hypothetical protein